MQRTYAIENGKIVSAEGDNCPILVFINPGREETSYLVSTTMALGKIRNAVTKIGFTPENLEFLELLFCLLHLVMYNIQLYYAQFGEYTHQQVNSLSDLSSSFLVMLKHVP